MQNFNNIYNNLRNTKIRFFDYEQLIMSLIELLQFQHFLSFFKISIDLLSNRILPVGSAKKKVPPDL